MYSQKNLVPLSIKMNVNMRLLLGFVPVPGDDSPYETLLDAAEPEQESKT